MTPAALNQTPDREIFAAYVCDEPTAAMLKTVVSERNWAPGMVFSGGIAGAVRALGAMPCPSFLIVDISTSDDPRADMQSLADVCDEGTVVLAIGSQNDVSLYRDLLHAGVHDYLVKPLDSMLLRESLATAEEALFSPEEEEPVAVGSGRTIFFMGLRGGIGTSTLAINSAWLKGSDNQKTILLDLDMYFGTSALMFDMEPGRGLADALENPGRVDGLFLERAVIKPLPNLSVLCMEAPVGGIIPPNPEGIRQLLDAMQEGFHNVIVDIPRQMLGDNPSIIAAATDIVLVTDLSLASARDCIRMQAFLKNNAPDAHVHIVVNKTGSVPAEVDEKDFENSIEHDLNAKIPFDAKATLLAAQKGKIVCDGAAGSKLSAAIDGMRALLEDPISEENVKRASWLTKFLKK